MRISFKVIIPFKPDSQVIIDILFFLFLFRLKTIYKPVVKLLLFLWLQEFLFLIEASDTLLCQVIVGDLGSDSRKILDWLTTIHPFEIVLLHVWILVN